jgi:hypothetical protein
MFYNILFTASLLTYFFNDQKMSGGPDLPGSTYSVPKEYSPIRIRKNIYGVTTLKNNKTIYETVWTQHQD